MVLGKDNVLRNRHQVIFKEYPGMKGLEDMSIPIDEEIQDKMALPIPNDDDPTNYRRVTRSMEDPTARLAAPEPEQLGENVLNLFDGFAAIRLPANLNRVPFGIPGAMLAAMAEDEDDDDSIPDLVASTDDDEPPWLDGEPPPTPANTDEALSGPYHNEWRAAIIKEWNDIYGRDTWDEVDRLPHGVKAVSSKFAFRVTKEADGTYKFKARLVGRGFSQIAGQDYDTTYSPTMMHKTLCVLLNVAASTDMEVETADVGNAYLVSNIDKTIYMELPKELRRNAGIPEYVLLKKALYGLKQAGELWNKTIHEFLLSTGMERSTSDVCLYINADKSKPPLYVGIYVDDIVIAAKEQSDIDRLKELLIKRFEKMKFPGPISKFLGLEITRDRQNRTFTISQAAYIHKIVHEHLPEVAREANIPGDPNVNLHTAERGDGSIQVEVGKLRYAADRSRADILAATNLLGKAAASPGIEHLKAAIKAFQYLKKTAEDGVKLGGTARLEAVAFCDASYIAEGDSKSQYGYCIHLSKSSGACIARAKSASHVHHHPSEAETYAVDEVCKEIVWLRVLLSELGYTQDKPTIVYTDSQSTIDTVATAGNFQKQKQYNRNINYIRELVSAGIVKLVHIEGEEQHADMLTKNLAVQKHQKFKNRVMNGLQDMTLPY